MSVLVVHPTGNQNVRAVLAAFEGCDMLEGFWTTLAFSANGAWIKYMPAVLRREMLRRSYAISWSNVYLRPQRELLRQFACRMGLAALTRAELGYACVDKVYQDLDRHVSKYLHRKYTEAGLCKAVYGYDGGALFTFTHARSVGVKCIFDLPCAHWRLSRPLLREEASRRPEWAPTLQGGLDSDQKLEMKDHELLLADLVVVASSMTKESLALSPLPKTTPIAVIPYGAPEPINRSQLDISLLRKRKSGRLKVLFVGRVSQHKGVAELFEASEKLGAAVDLTVIGGRVSECGAADAALRACNYMGSIPHAEVLEQMRLHDVLVFPSLLEGFGLVILEAMAQGLPVITTANTGGRDVITSGVDGVIIPIRSSEAIEEALLQLYNDRALLADMSEAAWRRASLYTWERYGAEIVNVARAIIG